MLLFDIGGVLVENVGFDKLKALLPIKLEKKQIQEKWLDSNSVRQFELGRLSPNHFAIQFISEWCLEISAEKFLQDFATWPKGFFPGARTLLRKLRKRNTVCCLSNSNPIHWSLFDDFDQYFDASFSSHLTGFIKPDHAAFIHVMEVLSMKPNEIHFFDDSQSNIESAIELGINAYQVMSFQDIELNLHKNGLF